MSPTTSSTDARSIAERAEHPLGLGGIPHEEPGPVPVGEEARHGVRPHEPCPSGDGHPHGMIMA